MELSIADSILVLLSFFNNPFYLEFINNFSLINLNYRIREWLSCILARSYPKDDIEGMWNDFPLRILKYKNSNKSMTCGKPFLGLELVWSFISLSLNIAFFNRMCPCFSNIGLYVYSYNLLLV